MVLYYIMCVIFFKFIIIDYYIKSLLYVLIENLNLIIINIPINF